VLLAARGDLPAARRAFGVAAGLYRDLGAQWDVRHAASRLRGYGIRLGGRGQRARPTRGRQALTPTETKIAYLVARGQSNPDIAAELWLSRNTVQNHIAHILAKLGARSRAEIVYEALNHPAASQNPPPG
jgi:DNA-binding CsgD family transcriptional regulator